MSLCNFELGGLDSFERLGETLEVQWTHEGQSSLAATARGQGDLARCLYSVDDQSGEVSPFIYVMF
ncbi:MAG: hypothetical protein ACHBNF_03540 [Chromatiales bacterium]